MKTELLSPAGDLDTAYAAFYYGADAVYLGLKNFSARAEAINFSPEELDELTAYAHAHGKKVYVALNTLIQENELEAFIDTLAVCHKLKVDAVIVQDLGAAAMVQSLFPDLPLHASTQLAVHNLEGALALKKAGFSRVVLARELSYPEIKKIEEKSGLEIEVFIHGALCYSYSGLCSFSSFETARSANRGKCIYACRAAFKTKTGEKHPFSMKDLALEEDVLKLKNMSLKIEGRKKNALYVAAVTRYYRHFLDTGKKDVSLAQNIQQIFARPWTKLHFNGRKKDVTDPFFVGHRGMPIGTVHHVAAHDLFFTPSHAIARYDGIQIDIDGTEKPFGFSVESLRQNNRSVFEAIAGKPVVVRLPQRHPFIKKGDRVYLASSSAVKGAYPYPRPKPGAFRNTTDIRVDVFIDTKNVTACACDQSASIDGAFLPAKDSQKTKTAARETFLKTADKPFHPTEIFVHNPHNLFVPISTLNELRRNLYDKIVLSDSHPALPHTTFRFSKQKPMWIVKTDNPSCLTQIPLNEVDEIILELTPDLTPEKIAVFPSDKVRLALPLILRNTSLIKKQIEQFSQIGFSKWEIANVGGLTLLSNMKNISFDASLYIMNSQSMGWAFAQKAVRVCFSVEDTGENIRQLAEKTNQTCLIVYQDTPLFISDTCVKETSCLDCDKKETHQLISRGSETYELITRNCQTVLIGTRPLCLAREAASVSAGAFRIDFCHHRYTPRQAADIWSLVHSGRCPDKSTSANFNKKFA